jgi:hypothetical protein
MLAVVLWLLLVAVVVSLSLLFWSRWGQYRTLSKSLAISMLLHLIVVLYTSAMAVVREWKPFAPEPPEPIATIYLTTEEVSAHPLSGWDAAEALGTHVAELPPQESLTFEALEPLRPGSEDEPVKVQRDDHNDEPIASPVPLPEAGPTPIERLPPIPARPRTVPSTAKVPHAEGPRALEPHASATMRQEQSMPLAQGLDAPFPHQEATPELVEHVLRHRLESLGRLARPVPLPADAQSHMRDAAAGSSPARAARVEPLRKDTPGPVELPVKPEIARIPEVGLARTTPSELSSAGEGTLQKPETTFQPQLLKGALLEAAAGAQEERAGTHPVPLPNVERTAEVTGSSPERGKGKPQRAPSASSEPLSPESTASQRTRFQPSSPSPGPRPQPQRSEVSLPSQDGSVAVGNNGVLVPPPSSFMELPPPRGLFAHDDRTAGKDPLRKAVPMVAAPSTPTQAHGSVTGSTASAMRPEGAGRVVPEPLRLRVHPDRTKVVLRRGGSPGTEAAVQAALQWLARHQSSDGRWDGDSFTERCPSSDSCGGAGMLADEDAAMTGLALLCFLAAGQTHMQGEYHDVVHRGLRWLRALQRADGDMRGRGRMYAHAIATMALCEAFALSGDPRLADPCSRAVGFVIAAQNPQTGGWRYEPRSVVGDTSVYGWQVLALRSGALAGIPVPEQTWARAQGWLARVSWGQYGGLASYLERDLDRYGPTPAMTAEALTCRLLLGARANEPAVQEAVAYLVQHAPDARNRNVYYWYYGSLALSQIGGDAWQQWNERLRTILVRTQRRDGHAAGSWDPAYNVAWDTVAGRVYTTALSTLCLQSYYRYALPAVPSSSPASLTP